MLVNIVRASTIMDPSTDRRLVVQRCEHVGIMMLTSAAIILHGAFLQASGSYWQLSIARHHNW